MSLLAALKQYFAIGVNPDAALPATYDPVLVVVSCFVAVLAGFAFIYLLHRITDEGPSPARLGWMLGGAVIMGLGIWAMHFLGMLAYQLPISVTYDPAITIGSVVPAVLASAWCLKILTRPGGASVQTVVSGSLVFGLGIGVMHYTGMAALRLNATVRYDPVLFTASILTAMLLATAALGTAALTTRRGPAATLASEMFSALLIGLAVSGMHYTAMTSTLCFPLTGGATTNAAAAKIDSGILAVMTSTVATLILIAAIGAMVLDRRRVIAIGQREQASKRAQVTGRWLQLIMDNVADAVIAVDGEGTVESVNRAAERIFGYNANEIVGQPLSLLMTEPAEGNALRLLEECVEHGDGADHGSGGIELIGRHRSGTGIHLEAVVSEVKEDDRRVYVAAFRDITERTRSAQALRRAKDEAERANRAKSEFLSHMSHELRTPLNAVIGLTETLLQVDVLRADPEKVSEYLSDIRASGKHLLALVDDILDLSAIEGGRRTVNAETFDLVEEIGNVMRPLRTSIDGARASLAVPERRAPVLVTADRQSFGQVLLNLASNALNHGGDDVTVRIDVDDGSAEPYACVTVSDNGPGIPEGLVVGQPFTKANAPYVQPRQGRRPGGTGLGLFIVTQLMALNGGRCEIRSAAGAGTSVATFWPRAGGA